MGIKLKLLQYDYKQPIYDFSFTVNKET